MLSPQITADFPADIADAALICTSQMDGGHLAKGCCAEFQHFEDAVFSKIAKSEKLLSVVIVGGGPTGVGVIALFKDA